MICGAIIHIVTGEGILRVTEKINQIFYVGQLVIFKDKRLTVEIMF